MRGQIRRFHRFMTREIKHPAESVLWMVLGAVVMAVLTR
jgi:hypothetical protein